VWIAICKRTRQVVAYYIGSRDTEACQAFWDRIPLEYKQSQTYSDYWEAYKKVINTGKHQSIGKHTGLTNHVERWNCTLRQRVSRFVRLSLSFSKIDSMHELVLKLFIDRYNRSVINAY
jgi:IS1 family transposase